MKRTVAMGLATVFALPIISTASMVVHAEDVSVSSSPTTTNTSTTSAGSTGNQKPAEVSEDAKSIADRVAQRKTELKTKLTNAQKVRLQGKCKAAQGLLGTEKGRIKGVETNRSEAYANLLTRLNDLSERLKTKGVDTTALNADIATLKTKIDTFNTDLTAYKQTVTDLAGMDCATDPDGFKASLETARTSLKKVNDDAAGIRAYLKDTIRPLLQTIRAQLEKPETSGAQSTTPTNNTSTTNNTPTGGNQ